jgi:hypothetical protein
MEYWIKALRGLFLLFLDPVIMKSTKGEIDDE